MLSYESMPAHQLLRSFIALLMLAALCFISYIAFKHVAATNYFYWYVRSGPIIALAVAALGMVFGGFDEDPGFISWHPLEYIGSYLQVAGVMIFSMGSTVKSESKAGSIIDVLFSLPMTILLFICVCAWLLLIVPFQYFLFLPCGALSRRALRQTAMTEFRKMPGVEQETADAKPFDKVWLDNGLRKRPYALTSSFAAVLLYISASFITA